MGIMYDPQNLVSNGGTELMLRGLESRLNPNLLDKVVISRSLEVLEQAPTDKLRIFWAHEVPATRQVDVKEFNSLMNKRWVHFDRMVFVSNWQMLEYIRAYHMHWGDWGKLKVIHNAIQPIEKHQKPTDKIRLIYTSSPQRGLALLYEAFDSLCKQHDNLELEVFSSFKLYQNPVEIESDKQFVELFDKLKSHPKIIYHGVGTNDEVRDALKRSHIFAYPCIWGETSCLSLIEAMSAGLICVHPNNAALFETGANWTNMYHFDMDVAKHISIFTQELHKAIDQYKNDSSERLELQRQYVEHAHSWNQKIVEWERYIGDSL